MNKSKQHIPDWLKSKGYLHLTPNIDVKSNWRSIRQKVENPFFIQKYAFYPLIHASIKERKYKKISEISKKRSHKYVEDGITKSTVKERPLHYATHFDALIYGYYASLIQKKYEQKIKQKVGITECITAYRKIKIVEEDPLSKNKGTIHFAKDVFNEIKERSLINEDTAVLTFDIKKFFPSLDHETLKKAWCKIMDFSNLENHKAHLNVFKASTNFSYVLLDNFRVTQNNRGKKEGFDEKKLAEIRKKNGHSCFFESRKEFRESIKSGKLKLYKHPFKNKDTGIPTGIPQGLPISAVLANIYLFDFDVAIFENLVKSKDCFYRRYSDDIIIICKKHEIEHTKSFVSEQMEKYKVEISKEKTEVFLFKHLVFNNQNESRLTSIKLKNGEDKINSPLIYLGFEFRGFNTLVKSTNLAKFYRKMISVVKRRARRTKKQIESNPFQNKAIFINQIKRVYLNISLKKVKIHLRKKRFELNERGEYIITSIPKEGQNRSNYFSYIKRAAKIMEDNSINRQLKKAKYILFTSIKKKLNI